MPDEPREPDYRFTLANERTFLAWIRTALALVAGGAAVTHLLPDLEPPALRYGLGLGLVVIGFLLAATSYRRWSEVDKAIRADQPLPRQRMPLLLTIAVSAAIAVAFVLLVID
ncbi:putative membrane protein [Herbihabitans rhizosphaerae]|uniref:Putative membrane protein n=1 Tax=Herbihabitans rhizosphaerae TaxID=1872711 RepID=A0A4Q7KCE2_9PSEU|nr:DUF202 domain-containing protein [Herbihabitans rhizosphaerae]RZS30326.1 putative membrane protein [Herbihabitans rhizosphaerae]